MWLWYAFIFILAPYLVAVVVSSSSSFSSAPANEKNSLDAHQGRKKTPRMCEDEMCVCNMCVSAHLDRDIRRRIFSRSSLSLRSNIIDCLDHAFVRWCLFAGNSTKSYFTAVTFSVSCTFNKRAVRWYDTRSSTWRIFSESTHASESHVSDLVSVTIAFAARYSLFDRMLLILL